MSTKVATRQRNSNLDNLTLARKEGWRDYVQAPARVRPELLTKRQIRRLSEPAADMYSRRRADWHNNLGPFKTPMLAAVHEALWDIMDSNEQDGHRAKGAVAIDGFPGLGKSCALEEFAKRFHLREIARHGEFTRVGDERWPACRIGLRGNTSMRDLGVAMCDFYGHAGRRGATAERYNKWALDCVLNCETRLFIIDDLHFLHYQHHGGVQISNHFKYIANEFPVTVLFAGVGLGERGVLMDGNFYEDAILAQTMRRTTTLDMRPYAINTGRGRQQWRTLLITIEERLVLANKRPGMLSDELSEYLFIRSTGHIGSLMELIRRGCAKAVRTGTETLTRELFDSIKIDSAAERARAELESAFRSRRLTTQLKPSPARPTRLHVVPTT